MPRPKEVLSDAKMLAREVAVDFDTTMSEDGIVGRGIETVIKATAWTMRQVGRPLLVVSKVLDNPTGMTADYTLSEKIKESGGFRVGTNENNDE